MKRAQPQTTPKPFCQRSIKGVNCTRRRWGRPAEAVEHFDGGWYCRAHIGAAKAVAQSAGTAASGIAASGAAAGPRSRVRQMQRASRGQACCGAAPSSPSPRAPATVGGMFVRVSSGDEGKRMPVIKRPTRQPPEAAA